MCFNIVLRMGGLFEKTSKNIGKSRVRSCYVTFKFHEKSVPIDGISSSVIGGTRHALWKKIFVDLGIIWEFFWRRFGFFWGSRGPPEGSQSARRWLPEAPKGLEESPRGLQDASLRAPRGSKKPQEAPRGSKRSPSGLQEAPKRSPGGSQEVPRGGQELPRSSQDTPERFDEAIN